MENKVINNILNYNLITEGDTIVIGVSGGPDSMALLYTLIETKEFINFNIIIVHINHGVRGEEALKDELFVKEKAEELNIPYYSKTIDMVGYAKDNKISEEEAGRKLRYGFFRQILSKKGKGKIAVAHNKDDQAETLLMRIFRGTGIDGLKGMDFLQKDIIRPILNISREDIEKYIEENEIETVLDKTNLMPIYTRNQIRLELIPYIEKNFNPNLIDTMWRLSETSTLDSNFLERYSEDKYNNMLKSKDKTYIVLDVDMFNKEDESIKNRIVRMSIEKILGDLQGFSREHINSLVKLFELGETGKEIHLPRNIIGKVDYKELQIYIEKFKSKNIYSYKLNLGYNEIIDIGYELDLEVLPIEDVNLKKGKKDTRYFDYDKIEGELYIRNRRAGDRLVPFGMKGRKKLKDYFIDEKISRDLRDEIPLIIDEKNIIWVIGYRTSNLYKIDNKTKKVLAIRYQKSK